MSINATTETLITANYTWLCLDNYHAEKNIKDAKDNLIRLFFNIHRMHKSYLLIQVSSEEDINPVF